MMIINVILPGYNDTTMYSHEVHNPYYKIYDTFLYNCLPSTQRCVAGL